MARRNDKDRKKRERLKNIILAFTIIVISLFSLFEMERNEVKENRSKVQKITDKFVKIVDETVSAKEKEVMEI